MHFCDEVTIKVIAGRGGNGSISFRREKFIPRGGPDGGDGGNGGSIYFEADTRRNTLAEFMSMKRVRSEKGGMGLGSRMHGRGAEDRIVPVPPGTIVTDITTGKIIADLKRPGDRLCIARGGRGGYGNGHFATSTRQSPRFAEMGEPGEEKEIKLELKLVSDVGIIGLPSVGKSSFIARVSAAKPKIADYPFTTLVPNLGVVSLAQFGGDTSQSFVVCDVPGLIEGAHLGKGLGIQFLKHVSRNRILLHLLDGSHEDLVEEYKVILEELRAFDPELLKKPMVVAINKIDILDEETREIRIKELKKALKLKEIFLLSCATGEGVNEIIWKLHQEIEKIPKELLEDEGDEQRLGPATAEYRVFKPHLEEDPHRFVVEFVQEKEAIRTYRVSGRRIQQLVSMTDVYNEEALHRVYDVMGKMGITKELRKAGAKSGDELLIGKATITFFEL